MKPGIRVKTPVILQMEAVECGSAALAIILAYHGYYISLEELRYACGVSRDGSKAINILRAARTFGLKAQGAQADLDSLPELPYPFIAFWEFNHFVVVEGYDDENVYINDPAIGLRTLSHEEFSNGFTGVILLMELTPEFKKGGKKDSLWDNLKVRFASARKALIFIVIASLSLTIPNIILAGFSKIFIDDILIHQLSGWLLPLLWGMFLTALMRGAISWIEEIHLLRLQLKLIMTTSTQFLWQILRLPMSFFTQRYTGDIISRISANDRISAILSSDFSSSFVGLINMVLYAVFMLMFDWMLALIGIGIAAINAMIFLSISEHIANYTKSLLQEQGKLTGIEMVGLQGIETLKASGVEDDYFQRWAGYHAKTINSQQKIQLITSVLTITTPLLMGISTTLILGIGSLRIMDGYLTVGGLVAFQTLLASFNGPLNTLLGLGNKLQAIRGDISRLNDVLRNKEDPQIINEKNLEQSPLQSVHKLKGKLEFETVTFGYSPLDPPLFDGINFSLQEGKTIAVVGPSGCGKSTIAKLACGLYPAWSGTILLDGHRYSDIPRELISQSLAFVDQEIFLFEGTIRDNLTLWDNTIPSEDLEQAIHDAELGTLLTNRSHGLSTTVLSEGVNFSGGQRQQLEIARALAKKPSLLILDEATASLDAITEAKIVDNIRRRNCSALVIAHRLSTIRTCDEIVVLQNGKIIERGTHDELSRSEGAYQQLLMELSHAETE